MSICEHQRRKNICIECDGISICEHKRVKNQCKECGGVSICEHQRQRNICKECGGASICEHKRQRNQCKECDGASICEHKRQKSLCKECDGTSICEHKRKRSSCKECDGASICEHKRRRNQCKECGGASICEHQCIRNHCIICSPQIACNYCKLNIMSRNKYRPYCFNCYCVLNPDIEHLRKYKIKENYLTDALKEMYLLTPFIQDQIIKGGCSKRRPDFLFELFTHTIIIENDENGHSNYDTTCDIAKLNETFTDLGDRPLVLIRFNPDKYKNKSCFDKEGKLIKIEWVKRVNILKETLIKHLKQIPNEIITIIKLFFD